MSKKKKNKSVSAPVKKTSETADWDELDDDLDADEEETEEEDSDDEEEEEADDEEEDSDDEEEEEADDEEEDSDDIDSKVNKQHYTVVNGFELGGKTFKPGQVINVACKYCALWNTPIAAKGGKCLCYAGAKVTFSLNEEEDIEWRMQPDRYSCQRYFVPLDVPDVVAFLKDDVHSVAVLRYALPIASAIASAQGKFGTYVEKNKIDDSVADTLLGTINDFAQLFTSAEQIAYVRPLLPFLTKKLRAKHKAKAAGRKAAYAPGDDVSWTDRNTGGTVSGLVRTVGGPKKVISLLVSGKHAETLRPKFVAAKKAENPKARVTFLVTYKMEDWATMNPQTISEAIVYDAPEE
jgi:hypothetical protein